MKSQDVDIVFSSGVLEYIPVQILREMLQECRRLTTPDSVMVPAQTPWTSSFAPTISVALPSP
ncbi:MAG: class I SAM-dependent methyltransferase [Verrucomicrobiota bacterium]